MRLWLVGLVLVGACASLPPAPPNPPLPQISDSAVRVQVDPQRGGGISFLEILDGTRSSGNIVDQGDLTGRGIQLALYHGASLPLPNAEFDPAAWPCHDNAALWGHDPVLMGNACQQLSGGSIISQAATSISVQSTPLEWNSVRGRSHVNVTAQTEILSTGVVQLTYTITNHEAFAFDAPNVQEAPCVYLNPRFTIRSVGDGWIALSDPDGWTIALVAPHAQMLTFNTGGGGQHPTALMQAWQPLMLQPESTASLSALLVVGPSLNSVKGRLSSLSN